MNHKPECNTNRHCAVLHQDGICPNPQECDCGASAPKESEDKYPGHSWTHSNWRFGPNGERWRFDLENTQPGFEYFPEMTIKAISDERSEESAVVHYAGCDSLKDYCNHPNRKCDCEKCDCGASAPKESEPKLHPDFCVCGEINSRNCPVHQNASANASESEPSWKEEFDKEFEMTFHNFDTTVIEIIHWKFKKFISTQIIEKLIEDIPDKGLVRVEQPDDSIATIDIQEVKQQLRDKWL